MHSHQIQFPTVGGAGSERWDEESMIRRLGRGTDKILAYVFDINIIVLQRHLDQYMPHFIYLFDKVSAVYSGKAV